MFSNEKKNKEVQLLLQYDMSYAAVMHELGYPARRNLINWYEEYIENGDFHGDFIRKPKSNEKERQKAVNYYLEHGKCMSRTVKVLGYPSRP